MPSRESILLEIENTKIDLAEAEDEGREDLAHEYRSAIARLNRMLTEGPVLDRLCTQIQETGAAIGRPEELLAAAKMIGLTKFTLRDLGGTLYALQAVATEDA